MNFCYSAVIRVTTLTMNLTSPSSFTLQQQRHNLHYFGVITKLVLHPIVTATEKLGITATLSGVHTIMTTENNIDCWSFTEKTLVKQNLGTGFKILLKIGRFTHYAFGGGEGVKHTG